MEPVKMSFSAKTLYYFTLTYFWISRNVQHGAGSNLSDSSNHPPPEKPPEEIVDSLTMGGRIPLEFFFVDDSNKGKGTHFKYSWDEIVHMIEKAKELVHSVGGAPIPPPPETPQGSKTVRLSDIWLIHALLRYPIENMNVAVFGSMSPWYESIVLAMGASSVTVIEYNKLTYDHPSITTIQSHNLPENSTFDALLSISSFDHDGLGRYGDPINPNGDLDAMEHSLSLLRPGGRMYLTVPIGPDVVVWNLHRRYGQVRLPRLLEGWRQLEVIGWNEDLLTKEVSWMKTYEPVFVLKKQSKDEL